MNAKKEKQKKEREAYYIGIRFNNEKAPFHRANYYY